jgi:hypothetical protein
MSLSILQEIEARIRQLSTDEKRLLMDRLADDLQAAQRADFTAALADMAADPDIQRELRAIEEEFADATEDGLENL